MTEPLTDQSLGATYYKPPARLDVARTITAFGIALVAAVVVGAVYVYVADWLDEWPYRLASAGAAGLATGAGAAWVVRFGRIRIPATAILLATTLALACLYAAWVTFVWLTMRQAGYLFSVWDLVGEPLALWNLIVFLNDVGTWTYGGDTIRGVPLLIIWIIEALVIIGGAVALAWWAVSSSVACRHCGTDLVRESGLPKFSARVSRDEKQLVADLESKNFDALLALGPLEDEDDPEYNLELLRCRSCGRTNVLSLRRTAWTQHGDGRITVETTPLMNQLLVSATEAEDVIALKSKLPSGEKADDVHDDDDDDDDNDRGAKLEATA